MENNINLYILLFSLFIMLLGGLTLFFMSVEYRGGEERGGRAYIFDKAAELFTPENEEGTDEESRKAS